MRKILIVSENRKVLDIFHASLDRDYSVASTPSRKEAIEILNNSHPDFLFIDFDSLMSGVGHKQYQESLKPFLHQNPDILMVVMSSREMMREIVSVVKAGASDYLNYPIDPEEIRIVIKAMEESRRQRLELDYFRDEFWKQESLEIVQTKNKAMNEVFSKIHTVAPTQATVLIYGETGTGKTLLAKLIHRYSNRAEAQFISVHCGAIPSELLESELFGHEKGAFTGAIRKKMGKFELAHNGTIFLDEICTMPTSAQIKLLQVLQDGTFSHVGGEAALNTNARIITATNGDLVDMVEKQVFRKDLYYRLNIFPVEIPPLRERLEDIPFLVEVFLNRLRKSMQKDIQDVHPMVLEAFMNYSWPGNIRELENLMERAYILETSTVLSPESFPKMLFEEYHSVASIPLNHRLPIAEARRRAVEEFERQYIKDLISQNQGTMKQRAEQAGITTRQLNKLTAKYGIRKNELQSS